MSHAVPGEPSTDRNLLFGVLALQADLLDAARFAEACSAWAARKDTPLASLLVERGWLTAEERDGVEQFLQRKLKKHAGDVGASLAEVLSDPVRQTLTNVADPGIHQTLSAVAPAGGFHEKTTVNYEPVGRERYTLTRVHARGGIGQVWLARDDDLGRDVALKELLGTRGDHPAVVARFIEEAKITGQLEHPNIVPVYELARPAGANAPPFYTMRFVRGRTLGAAVKEYHRKRRAREAGRLELRQLLSHFIAVCNAVSYAHSRGVLHRDLKPGNVVLGDYGEVIVLDWGLAKIKGGADPDASLLPVSVNGESSREGTVQGQAIGTPSYMPPEQAEGRLDLVGERSDVYGLGAVLYEILTGDPPFDGPDTPTVLVQVVTDPPVPPRQKVPDTARPLEAVCLKALAKKPGGRYGTVKELRGEVERWLADEPVTAYREPWLAKSGRWLRRHRTMAAMAATACLVALGLGAFGLAWQARERGQRWAGADAALKRAGELRVRAYWTEARAALDQAEALLGASGPDRLRQDLATARRDLDLAFGLNNVRVKRSTLSEYLTDASKAESGRAYEQLFTTIGPGAPGDDPGAVAARVSESNLRENLVAALDDWAMVAQGDRRKWVLAVARAADPDPWRDRLRDPAVWDDGTRLTKLLGEVPPRAVTPALGVSVSLQLPNIADADGLLRGMQTLHPDDFWLNLFLGWALWVRGRLTEAEAFQRAAVALRPASPDAWDDLALTLRDRGELDQAAMAFRKAIDLDHGFFRARANMAGVIEALGRSAEALKLREEILAESKAALGPEHSDTLWRMDELAETYHSVGRHVEGLKLREELLAKRKALFGPNAADTIGSMVSLAFSYSALGRNAEALKLDEEVLALRKKNLAPDHPDTLWSMNAVGRDYFALGRYAEALRIDEEVLALRKKKLGPDHPETARTMRNLARDYFTLGRHADALKLDEEAVEVRKDKLGPRHGDTFESMDDLATDYVVLGRHAEALKVREVTLTLREKKLGPDHPDTLASMQRLAFSYSSLGRHADALKLLEPTLAKRKAVFGPEHPDTLYCMYLLARTYHALGRHEDADKLYQDSVSSLERKLTENRAKLGPSHPDTLKSALDLASIYDAVSRREEALKLREETLVARRVALGPDHPDTLSIMWNVANSYSNLGRNADALKLFEELRNNYKTRPDDPSAIGAVYSLANCYAALGRGAEAVKFYEEAVAKCKAIPGPKNSRTLLYMSSLALSYATNGRRAEALKTCDESLTLYRALARPDALDVGGMSMFYVANAYGILGQYDQALKLHEEVLEKRKAALGPDNPLTLGSIYQVARSYSALGRHADAVKLFQEMLTLQRARPGADEAGALQTMEALAIGYASMGRYAEALKQAEEIASRGESKFGPRNPFTATALYNCACFRARVSRESSDTAKGAGLAMNWLKKAIAAGFNDVEQMKKDPDLDALRSREDFKKLLAELEAKGKNPRGPESQSP